MKKIIVLIITFFSLITSCKKDPLDITPDGRITIKEVFQDEKRMEAYLNTVYGSIPGYFNSYVYFSLLAGATDEAAESDVGNNLYSTISAWVNGSLTPNSSPLLYNYPLLWAGIRDANVFLENIDNANVSNESKRSRLKGEATLLRAFYYWELIKQYGSMPVIDKSLDATFDYASLKRPSFQESVDFIIKDCDNVISNPDLPLRLTINAESGRFTKSIAYAIKSQALLYNASPLWNPNNDLAKWKAAADASKIALAVLTADGKYELAADYGDYFLNTADINVSPRDKETIYQTRGDGGTHLITMNGIPSKPGISKAGVGPSQELVDSYDMKDSGEPAILGYSDTEHLQPIINTTSGYNENDPYAGRDPRFYASIWFNGASYDNISGSVHILETFIGGKDQLIKTPPNILNTHTGYYLRKFIDPLLQAGQSSSASWKKYRLAEIYLNLAEAENEANGPTTEAYNSINTIRTRAEMPSIPLGLTKDEFRKRVHNERRVELAFEEHRFWDVRRWKILDKTDQSVAGLEITQNANQFIYTRFLAERRNAWMDKYLIFPIPLEDASNIPDFGVNQNPGW